MDLVMQIGTQAHTHRAWKYFQERSEWHNVYPQDFAEGAVEVGPFNDQDGPCLVLFNNMHLTPHEVNQWLEESFVGRVCTRVFWLEHTIPAVDSRAELVQAVLSTPAPPGLECVRIEIYPKKDAMDIGNEILDAGYPYPMHPVHYSHVLYIVQLAPDSFRWSYLPHQQAWKMSSTAPARFDKSVATAINKLAEAMQVLGLKNASIQQQLLLAPQQQPQQLDGAEQPPSQTQQQRVRWAIDIGACPGGWTSYLADNCNYNVIAIDPAPLHPDVTARPGVVQILGKAQEVDKQINDVLAGQQADLLVCDMNSHPVRVAEYLLPLLPKLKPGGWLILTLKFYGRGRDKTTIKETLDDYLKGEMQPGRVTWLLANTLCERTYLAKRRES